MDRVTMVSDLCDGLACIIARPTKHPRLDSPCLPVPVQRSGAASQSVRASLALCAALTLHE